MITLDRWITSDDKYPERAKSYELNATVIRNAKVLLRRVNAMLTHLGIAEVEVTSGFRPSDVNKVLPNSAKRSAHMSGEAIDLADADGDLKKLVTKAILEKFDLYREDSTATPKWLHAQSRPTKSGRRIFLP